jgi:hypothetical protein
MSLEQFEAGFCDLLAKHRAAFGVVAVSDGHTLVTRAAGTTPRQSRLCKLVVEIVEKAIADNHDLLCQLAQEEV